jgi:two-component system phosphate regulon sensor histidine kinase PhoR
MLLVSVAMAFRTAAAARESRHLLGLERDQLLASLSHEIRTPLTAVAGFSHVLSTSWDVIEDVERQELIELIGSEAESLVDIIGDMNALVRSELDAASLELERIQGKHLIAEAIKLVFRLDGQLPVRAVVEPYLELVCDRRRMVQVLRALFENAVRYGDGKILVVAKRTKTGRVIEVHDNGSGVELYIGIKQKNFIPPLFRDSGQIGQAQVGGGTSIYGQTKVRVDNHHTHKD